MAMLVLDSLVTVVAPAWGTNRTRGNALHEEWSDPRESGLYLAAQGLNGPQAEHAVLTTGSHVLLGLPRRTVEVG